jgi:histidinol-phosphate phosphatase family protein
MKPAIFLDRDGTLIESVHYLNKKEQVKLLPGVSLALKDLQDAGYLLILVTNQAAIGKGLLTVEGLYEIQEHIDTLMATDNVKIDDWYFCPEVGRSNNREVIEHQDRKPGPGMLREAAINNNIDLGNSWMVGDMLSDTLAGRNAGVMKTILLESAFHDPKDIAHFSVDYVAQSMPEVRDIVLSLRQSPRTV